MAKKRGGGAVGLISHIDLWRGGGKKKGEGKKGRAMQDPSSYCRGEIIGGSRKRKRED